MNASAHSKLFTGRILAAGAGFALCALLSQHAQAQNLTINFRFDGQSGAAATTQTIAGDSAGQSYTIDVWASITGSAGQDPTKVGLVTLRFRGLSSTTNNSAFSTGAGIGVTSFTMLSPFNNTANLPQILDVGSASSYSVTSITADGLSDFGGTQSTSAAVANSNSGTTPQFGGTSTTTSEAIPNGWEFMVGQFVYHTGQASSTAGATTSLLPVTGLGAAASKQSFTIDGGTTFTHGDWTSGSAISFVVASVAPPGELEDNSNTPGVYGPAKTTAVAGGGTYAGLKSTVVGLVAGTTGGSPAFPPNGVGNVATILAGTNSRADGRQVSMSWRSRLVGSPTGGQLDETHGGPGSALQATTSTTGLVSDVLNLTGLETGTPNPNSTDAFVLDMTYNPAQLPKGGPPAIEQGLAINKLIYMVSPAPGPDNGLSQYVHSVDLNTGNTVLSPLDPRYGFVGSYSAFVGAFGPGLVNNMGAWGTDPGTHETWAILDHNSTFAVVPEPSAILLAGLGLLGLFGLRRRAKMA